MKTIGNMLGQHLIGEQRWQAFSERYKPKRGCYKTPTELRGGIEEAIS
ncbi:hypothetical protein J7L06_06255 [Candidatus Bathyarchaeota archaeon]|nr:hypothetical protein [Candidatus Bathyarchaeota archaeon]